MEGNFWTVRQKPEDNATPDLTPNSEYPSGKCQV